MARNIFFEIFSESLFILNSKSKKVKMVFPFQKAFMNGPARGFASYTARQRKGFPLSNKLSINFAPYASTIEGKREMKAGKKILKKLCSDAWNRTTRVSAWKTLRRGRIIKDEPNYCVTVFFLLVLRFHAGVDWIYRPMHWVLKDLLCAILNPERPRVALV